MNTRYLAVVFADLERHSLAWSRMPREQMVGVVAEYRYLAESLAGQYGALYLEWAGDGHMFLFESADTASQFSLRLIEDWRRRRESISWGKSVAPLPLRVGCHFGVCTQMAGGEGWIGRANALAKSAEREAEPDSIYVTESVLDLIDLPLYAFEEAGSYVLKGDHLPRRALYRVIAFDGAGLELRAKEALTAEDWFRRGVASIGTEFENSEEEAECYREALRLRPDYAEAHNNLAVLLRARGEQVEAARHYQEALRFRPDYPDAHSNYASLLAARGSVSGAADHYREALGLRPDSVDAHHGYASLLARSGDLAGAAEHYEQVLRLRPDYPEAHSNYAIVLDNLGLLLRTAGDEAGAESHLRMARELAPETSIFRSAIEPPT